MYWSSHQHSLFVKDRHLLMKYLFCNDVLKVPRYFRNAMILYAMIKNVMKVISIMIFCTCYNYEWTECLTITLCYETFTWALCKFNPRSHNDVYDRYWTFNTYDLRIAKKSHQMTNTWKCYWCGLSAQWSSLGFTPMMTVFCFVIILQSGKIFHHRRLSYCNIPSDGQID
jgi:hypothetical protein